MSKTAKMTVWAQDPFSYDIIPPSFTVFRKPNLNKVNARDIFVLTSVPELPAVTEFVRAANHRNHLRTLFIREDDNAQFLPQMLYEAKLKISRHILVHSDIIHDKTNLFGFHRDESTILHNPRRLLSALVC